jgi:hypothetical protein
VLVQVWSPDGFSMSAFARFCGARSAWANARHLDVATTCALLPTACPWSLDDPGADMRLSRLGLSRSDVPRMRIEAEKIPARA